MRTNEERTRLICSRARELKKERQKGRQRFFTAACLAASLALIVFAGVNMPEAAGANGVSHALETASLLGSSSAMGYILMGLLSFALGVCVTALLYRLRRRQEEENREDEDDEL